MGAEEHLHSVGLDPAFLGVDRLEAVPDVDEDALYASRPGAVAVEDAVRRVQTSDSMRKDGTTWITSSATILFSRRLRILTTLL